MNPRVMLVDDNALNRMTGRALLHRFCREVVVADGGRNAVELVRDFRPDVILMDISMPDVDGYEATRRIRQLHLESQPHIIAVTGHVQAAIEQRALESGMDGFLEKPFTLEQLHAQVMNHCGVVASG
ncbi:MAG: response regulator [Planctomycetota bacterium]